jgi:hypothetical protein
MAGLTLRHRPEGRSDSIDARHSGDSGAVATFAHDHHSSFTRLPAATAMSRRFSVEKDLPVNLFPEPRPSNRLSWSATAGRTAATIRPRVSFLSFGGECCAYSRKLAGPIFPRPRGLGTTTQSPSEHARGDRPRRPRKTIVDLIGTHSRESTRGTKVKVGNRGLIHLACGRLDGQPFGASLGPDTATAVARREPIRLNVGVAYRTHPRQIREVPCLNPRNRRPPFRTFCPSGLSHPMLSFDWTSSERSWACRSPAFDGRPVSAGYVLVGGRVGIGDCHGPGTDFGRPAQFGPT